MARRSCLWALTLVVGACADSGSSSAVESKSTGGSGASSAGNTAISSGGGVSTSGGASAGVTAGGGNATAGTAPIGGAGAGIGGASAPGGAGQNQGGALAGIGGTDNGGAAGDVSAGGLGTGGAGGSSTGGAGGSSAGGASNASGSGGVDRGGAPGGGAPGAGMGGAPEEPACDGSAENPTLEGSANRPQLSSEDACRFTALSYLRSAGNQESGLVEDNWDPTGGLGDAAGFSPTYRVASSGGTHSSVQAAIDAAEAAGGSDRVFISVDAGTYREVVCVPSGAPPITLYGTSSDATQTLIVYDNYAGKSKASGTPANPCNPNASSTTYGTSGSATFAAFAADFQAKNLTISNDTDESAVSGGAQAVALMVQGDRAVFENVRVLGNQDTLYGKTPNVESVNRAYFKDCYVEGDTDFIFGRATFVLDGCAIQSRSNRTTSGAVLAPSTDSRNPYGILVANSTLTAEAGLPDGSIQLGRAWDESQVDVDTYRSNVAGGVYPNGQGVFRNCELGAHIDGQETWRAAATTGRPYSSVETDVPANRFYEYENTGPGAAR